MVLDNLCDTPSGISHLGLEDGDGTYAERSKINRHHYESDDPCQSGNQGANETADCASQGGEASDESESASNWM